MSGQPFGDPKSNPYQAPQVGGSAGDSHILDLTDFCSILMTFFLLVFLVNNRFYHII